MYYKSTDLESTLKAILIMQSHDNFFLVLYVQN